MLKKQDFVFTIGYDGPSAVVDGQAKKQFGGMSALELANKGLFRAAYAAALYPRAADGAVDGAADNGDVDSVLAAYAQTASNNGLDEEKPANPGRLFGVFANEAVSAVQRSLVF
jgi:hypothetical protein